MKARASIGLATAVTLAIVLLAPAVLQGQKDKGKPVPPPPSIAVDVTLDNSAVNMIRADGVDPEAPYDATLSPQQWENTPIYDYYLTLWFRYSAADPDANRSLVFDFGSPRYSIGDMLDCYPTQYYKQDQGKVPYRFPVPTFLTTGITQGTEEPLWVHIQTSDEWVKEEGVWASTGRVLDLKPYMNGSASADPRYVQLRIEFRPPEFVGNDVYAYIAHNGPIMTPSSYGTTVGLAEVTPVDGGGFVLKPVSGDVLSGSNLPSADLNSWVDIPYDQLYGQNDANLTIKIPLGGSRGFKAWAGTCNVGTFNLPFAMTVK